MDNNFLKIQWMGTAGFRFYFRNKIILLDPYITRVKDRVTPIDSNPEYIKQYIDKADYIIVSHSHYDHFADTPTIAKMTNAEIIGSETTVNISKSFDVPEKQLTIVEKYDSLKYDEFEVTFLPSLHGTNSENKVPFPGFVTKPESTPVFASDFKEGDKRDKINAVYAKVRAFLDDFGREHGTVKCRDLVGCNLLTEEGQKYFKENNLREKCLGYVGFCSKLLEKYLKEEK